MAFLRLWLAGLCLALLALLAGGAMAAPPARIEAFDVERIAVLQPGARLNFTVFGSAGGQVQLEIEGARQTLPLRESDAGVYEGVYLIDAQDRIAAASRVIATLRAGDGSVVRAVLDEPLLLDGAADTRVATPPPAWPPIAAPRALPPPIEARREAAPPAPTNSVAATPPAWPPVAPQALPPITPQALPPITPQAWPPTAPQAWPPMTPRAEVQRPAPPAANMPPSDLAVFPPGCRQCAVVESIRTVEALPPRPPHTVPGNVLGALFGERVAEHVDRHVQRVNTAVDRAVTGRAQTPLPPTRYEVLLRMANGQRLTRFYDTPPPFQPGDMLVLPESAVSRGGAGAAARPADQLARGG